MSKQKRLSWCSTEFWYDRVLDYVARSVQLSKLANWKVAKQNTCGYTTELLSKNYSSIQNEWGEMSLQLRCSVTVWEMAKIVASKDHATEDMMNDRWTLHMGKFKEGKEPLFQPDKKIWDTRYEECRTRFEIGLSLTKSVDKNRMVWNAEYGTEEFWGQWIHPLSMQPK